MTDEPEAKPTILRDSEGRPIYRPDGKVLRGFMKSNARVRIIRGPIRSGTSSMCCMEIFRRACEQLPGPDGIRRTRWGIVRNSYPDLQQTTVKTWLQWFPEKDFGRFIWSKPLVHTLRKGDVVAEVFFLALDVPEDVSKLKSLEVTGWWFNEGEFTPKEVFDEAESRSGYYPPVKDGGATWSGLMMDLNAPSSDHWLPLMTGEEPFPEDMRDEDRIQYRWPEGWDYFVQPPGLIEEKGPDGKTVVSYRINPDAENLQWIPRIEGKPLYLETIKGKRKRWIDSRLMNRIIAPVEGEAVWPEYVEETHAARLLLPANTAYPLYVGQDFGRRPATVIGQLINDRWAIVGELTGTDMGATTYAPMLRRHLEEKFPDHAARYFRANVPMSQRDAIRFYGDPKGQDKVQSDERTAYDIFLDFGMLVRPAPIPSNNIETRIEAVAYCLNGMRDGQPRLLISPVCRVLKAALGGGYHISEHSRKQGDPKPEKNRYSDIADALQYMVLGAGEGRAMTGKPRGNHTAEPVNLRSKRRSLRRV
jgi:hypothetical protein